MCRFCSQCGEQLQDKVKFCPSCGNAASEKPTTGTADTVDFTTGGSIGFSNRINAPEIVEHIKKSKRSARGCAFVVVPLPFIIYVIVSFVSDEVKTADALVFGGGISVAFLLFYLLSCFISNAKRSWDGVVTDKRIYNKTKQVRDDDRWDTEHYTEYVITFRTDSGKKTRSVERFDRGRDDPEYYPYLDIGDRVRYYPQLSYQYEKYDKSHDSKIPCMLCKTFNDIHNDKCESCNTPLFK